MPKRKFATDLFWAKICSKKSSRSLREKTQCPAGEKKRAIIKTMA